MKMGPSSLTTAEWAQRQRIDQLSSVNHINIPQSGEPLINQCLYVVHNGAEKTSSRVGRWYGDVKGVGMSGQKLNQKVRLL